jgi:hypothetical protein
MANSSGSEKLKNLAFEIGASAVTLVDAVTDVEVIVICILSIEISRLPQHLFKIPQPILPLLIPVTITLLETA